MNGSSLLQSDPTLVRPITFQMRLLERVDFYNGFLETLGNLTEVGLTPDEAIRIWRGRNAAGVRTIVAIDGQKVIATGSLILEHKFIHSGGIIGHIEDVATHEAHQGRGAGSACIRTLIEMARESGCYKVILGCNDHNLPFYERIGFRKYENGMRIDLKECD
ncbi:MAG: GNAT family N-acetyltransferase [Zavarzinella sp.]